MILQSTDRLMLLKRAYNKFHTVKHHNSKKAGRPSSQVKVDEEYLLTLIRRRSPYVLWARSIEYDVNGEPIPNNPLAARTKTLTDAKWAVLPEERKAQITRQNVLLPIRETVRREAFAKLSKTEQKKWQVTANDAIKSGTSL